eukprot:CAMPEP_0114545488 /NCGR_PEP_ID=MMETSP0114-20121206/3426_1 /TAXON_ID=31324 /ORGANISM="Goniomonas sp, Strain m" /LENGTH=126 /DNA_ID=CAMNT_0001729917 /DNA_START=191 /DNA_END=572 /DNA_ORIENTATION=-
MQSAAPAGEGSRVFNVRTHAFGYRIFPGRGRSLSKRTWAAEPVYQHVDALTGSEYHISRRTFEVASGIIVTRDAAHFVLGDLNPQPVTNTSSTLPATDHTEPSSSPPSGRRRLSLTVTDGRTATSS